MVIKNSCSSLLLTHSSRSYEGGAYAPLSTGAGMYVIDNVMVFYTGAPANGDSRRGFASYFSYTPVWQRYFSGNSSNCLQTPGSCPCLDRREPCVKQGDTLESMPQITSWYSNELFKVGPLPVQRVTVYVLQKWPPPSTTRRRCTIVHLPIYLLLPLSGQVKVRPSHAWSSAFGDLTINPVVLVE